MKQAEGDASAVFCPHAVVPTRENRRSELAQVARPQPLQFPAQQVLRALMVEK